MASTSIFLSGASLRAAPQRQAPIPRRVVVAAERMNKMIDLSSDKVVTVVTTDSIDKQAAYCRCWASAKFPMCDGAHAKHNTATGDNVGPLLVKKP